MKKTLSIILCIILLIPNLCIAINANTLTGGTQNTTKELADGITYTNITTPSSSQYQLNNFNIVEFDPTQRNLYLDATANGTYANNAKTVANAMKAFAAANPEKTPIVGVNGDLWMTNYAHSRVEGSGTSYGGYSDAVVKKSLSLPRGFNAYNGEIVTSAYMFQETPYEGEFWSFGTTPENQVVMGCPELDITITCNNKVTNADGLNRLPANNALVVYSDKGCLNNYALDDAFEVLIKVDYDYTICHEASITGTVVGIYDKNTANNPTMQANHLILTARGNAVNKISSYKVGNSVTLDFAVTEKYGRNVEQWQNIQSCIGGHMPFVVNGVKNTTGGSTNYPTTILAIKNDGNVVMIVNDGRQSGYSTGLDFDKYWNLVDDLDLNMGLILDGGGSAEMVILDENQYKTVNKPSDGTSRSVVNSVILSVGPDHNTKMTDLVYPEPAINLANVDFTQSISDVLTPSGAQAHFEGSYEGMRMVVDETDTASGNPSGVISFGLPNTRNVNSNSIVGTYYPSLSLSDYNYIVITQKAEMQDNSPFHFQSVYAVTGTPTVISQDKFVGFVNMYNDGQFHSYVLDVSAFSGKLNFLHLGVLPVNGTTVSKGDRITINSIKFAKTLEEAQNYAAQQPKMSSALTLCIDGKEVATERVEPGKCTLKDLFMINYHLGADLSSYHISDDSGKVYYADTVIDTVGEVTLHAQKTLPFTDVNKNAWYYESVAYCVDNGYMNGTSATTFAPTKVLTRAQFVQILYNIEGEPEGFTGKTAFTDVPTTHWAAKAIEWAVKNDITAGTSATTFAPAKAVNRQTLATFILNYASFKGVAGEGRADLTKYGDGATVANWAQDAVAWAIDAGVFSSTSTTKLTFEPKKEATRAVVAQVVRGFVENVLNK